MNADWPEPTRDVSLRWNASGGFFHLHISAVGPLQLGVIVIVLMN